MNVCWTPVGYEMNEEWSLLLLSSLLKWSVEMICPENDRIDAPHVLKNGFDVQKIHRAVMTMFANQTKVNLIRNRFQVFKVLHCLYEVSKRASIRIPHMSLLVAQQALFVQNPRQNSGILLQHLFIILSKETLDITSGIRNNHQEQVACSLIHSLLRHHARFRREQCLKRGREHVLHHIYPSFPQFPLLGFLPKNAQIPADFSPKYCVVPSRTSRQW